MCEGYGEPCQKATDCCNLNCQSSGTCGMAACVSDGQACTRGGSPCCSTNCANGLCQPLNQSCKTAGNACTRDGDCCSKSCTGDSCAAPPQVSYCTQPGDICFHDGDCCTGVCAGATATSAGTCATLPTGCAVDGTICQGCNSCCSSLCAPFGTVGSHICQPASGCRVQGDLCTQDADCCGGDPTFIGSVPGAGLIKCMPLAGFPQIGACSNPTPSNCPAGQSCGNACIPEGNVCHYKGNGGCSVNSTRNDCCACTSGKDCCMLDGVGVPRCNAIAACVMAGGACATARDCCDQAPCVPDSAGHLHCGSSCVTAGGTCTTTADCCTGVPCVVPPGSTHGSCTSGGSGGAGGASGAGGAGGSSGCALFGQSCGPTVSCCAGQGTCNAIDSSPDSPTTCYVPQ